MISIIVPVYNVREYLGLCLRSVKTQTFRDWECVVVDDGSTDGSGEMLDNITYKDSRFTVIHQENKGLAAARNRAIASAKGDSLFFLDSDDWLDGDALDYMQLYSDLHPDVGRIVGLDYIHKEGGGLSYWSIAHPGVHEGDSPALFTEGCDVGHATACLYVRRNIPRMSRFRDVRMFEDMLFNMELMFAGVRTFISGRYIYHYIIRDGSLIHSYLTREQADTIRGEFLDIAGRYNPPEETRARCEAFLENAIKGRMGNPKKGL